MIIKRLCGFLGRVGCRTLRKREKRMERKIRECPFCGSESVTLNYNSSRFNKFYYYVACDICGARTRGEAIGVNDREDEWNNPAAERSINCWNQRAVKG